MLMKTHAMNSSTDQTDEPERDGAHVLSSD